MKLRFEYDGKKWTAEPGAYVRAGGVQLKVVSTDADGNATVKPDAKKNVEANEATEVVVPEPAPDPEAARKEAERVIAPLRAEWEKIDAEAKEMAEEHAKAAGAVSARRETVESQIAAVLLSIPRARKEPHTPIKLGGVVYRASRGRDGAAPSLTAVPNVSQAL